MERKNWRNIGVAAVVLLVPGGFALGAVLAARRYRAERAAAKVPSGDPDDQGQST